MVFTQGRGFVVGASFRVAISFALLLRFGLPRPRTPPLWQRGFSLVNCSVLRRLLAWVRSGVVKTFRCTTELIMTNAEVRFCGITMSRENYDDDAALRAYVAKHCRHLMTPLERRTSEYTVPKPFLG